MRSKPHKIHYLGATHTAWLYFIIEALRRARRTRGQLQLGERFMEDLDWWIERLSAAEGTRLERRIWFPEVAYIDITSDAATTIGQGGGAFVIIDGSIHYFTVTWTETELKYVPPEYGTLDWKRRHGKEGPKPLFILRLEFFLMVLGVIVFWPLLKGRRVRLRLVGDNMGSVNILNRGRSRRDPVVALMHRHLDLFCAKRAIEHEAAHLPGDLNETADALSRMQWRRFRELTKGLTRRRTQVPRSARALLLKALVDSKVPLTRPERNRRTGRANVGSPSS